MVRDLKRKQKELHAAFLTPPRGVHDRMISCTSSRLVPATFVVSSARSLIISTSSVWTSRPGRREGRVALVPAACRGMDAISFDTPLRLFQPREPSPPERTDIEINTAREGRDGRGT